MIFNNSINFYKNLPTIEDFQDSLIEKNNSNIPEDWSIIATDVIGSTKAVEEGKYKDVNMVGALGVIAIANLLKTMEFPFIFGGDGVTILIPSQYIEKANDILFDIKKQAHDLFALQLRIGIIPVLDLYERNYSLNLSKVKISPYYDQATLSGTGSLIIDKWLKKENNYYLINKKYNPKIKADFSGFTCRWQDIPTEKGDEVVALIIHIRDKNNEQKIFKKLLQKISLYFGNEKEYNPVKEKLLELLKVNSKGIKTEKKVQAYNKNILIGLWKKLKVTIEQITLKIAILYKIPLRVYFFNLKKIKSYQVISSDYKKYDGSLKMVITGSKESRKSLEEYLKKIYIDKQIFYGLSVSDKSTLTCMFHSKSVKDVHFVDGSNGGYVLASQKLKKQMQG